MEQINEVQHQEFFTIRQAAEFLKISTRTLNRAIQAGRCRAHKISDNRTIIHKKWLYAFAIFGKSRLTASERKELQDYLKD